MRRTTLRCILHAITWSRLMSIAYMIWPIKSASLITLNTTLTTWGSFIWSSKSTTWPFSTSARPSSSSIRVTLEILQTNLTWTRKTRMSAYPHWPPRRPQRSYTTMALLYIRYEDLRRPSGVSRNLHTLWSINLESGTIWHSLQWI